MNRLHPFLITLCILVLIWGWVCFARMVHYKNLYEGCHFLPHTSEEVQVPPDFNTQPHDVKG